MGDLRFILQNDCKHQNCVCRTAPEKSADSTLLKQRKFNHPMSTRTRTIPPRNRKPVQRFEATMEEDDVTDEEEDLELESEEESKSDESIGSLKDFVVGDTDEDSIADPESDADEILDESDESDVSSSDSEEETSVEESEAMVIESDSE